MNSLFNLDSPIMTFLNRMADIVILNILYVVCCLPIFTIGAATSALYYQVMKMSKNEESYAFRGFFKAFKENFRKATPAWLILLIIGVLLCTDLYILPMMGDQTPVKIFRYVCYMALLLWMITFSYTFPLFSKFENTIKNTLTNAILMGIRHLPFTLIIIFVNLTPVLAVLFLTKFLPLELMLMMMVWFSSAAYINGMLFHRVFAHYIPAQEEDSDGEEQEEEITE